MAEPFKTVNQGVPLAEAEAIVLLLHGDDEEGDSLASPGDELLMHLAQEQLVHTAVLLLEGPVQAGRERSWWNMPDISGICSVPELAARAKPPGGAVMRLVATAKQALQECRKQPVLVIGGFSQGSFLASEGVAALRKDGVESKLLVMSGFLDVKLIESVVNCLPSTLHIFQSHGEEDEYIPEDVVHGAIPPLRRWRDLPSGGLTLKLHFHEGAHIVGHGTMLAVAGWLKEAKAVHAEAETKPEAAGQNLNRKQPAIQAKESLAAPFKQVVPNPAIAEATQEQLVRRLLAASNHFEAMCLPAARTGPSEVRSAYKALARRVHPDKRPRDMPCGGLIEADFDAAFKRLAAAFEVLQSAEGQERHLAELSNGDWTGEAPPLLDPLGALRSPIAFRSWHIIGKEFGSDRVAHDQEIAVSPYDLAYALMAAGRFISTLVVVVLVSDGDCTSLRERLDKATSVWPKPPVLFEWPLDQYEAFRSQQWCFAETGERGTAAELWERVGLGGGPRVLPLVQCWRGRHHFEVPLGANPLLSQACSHLVAAAGRTRLPEDFWELARLCRGELSPPSSVNGSLLDFASTASGLRLGGDGARRTESTLEAARDFVTAVPGATVIVEFTRPKIESRFELVAGWCQHHEGGTLCAVMGVTRSGCNSSWEVWRQCGTLCLKHSQLTHAVVAKILDASLEEFASMVSAPEALVAACAESK